MAQITEKELQARLKSDELAGTYLLYGDEVYLPRFYADRFMKKAVSGMEVFNLHRFSGAVKAEELVPAVETLPMMSEYSFVEVCDYPFAQASDSELTAIKDMIARPNDTCVLVFRFENTEFSTKTAKCRSIFEHIKQHGFVAEFAKKSRSELAQIICRRAASRGCNMHPTVAGHLIDLCGSSLDNLLSEADKLFDYVGRNAITAEDVDAVAVKTLDASAYHLAKAICAGNADRVIGICEDLFNSKTEPIAVIAALAATYTDMYRAKLAEAQGMRAEDIAKDFGYGNATFKLKNASQNARRLTVGDIRESLDVLADADLRLKNVVCDPVTVTEQVLVRLIQIATR